MEGRFLRPLVTTSRGPTANFILERNAYSLICVIAFVGRPLFSFQTKPILFNCALCLVDSLFFLLRCVETHNPSLYFFRNARPVRDSVPYASLNFKGFLKPLFQRYSVSIREGSRNFLIGQRPELSFSLCYPLDIGITASIQSI